MTENEWTTLKVLLSMEHDRIIKRFNASAEALNYAYFQWIDKVQKHIHIRNEKPEGAAEQPLQVNEIVSGIAENMTLSEYELEMLTRILNSLRGIA